MGRRQIADGDPNGGHGKVEPRRRGGGAGGHGDGERCLAALSAHRGWLSAPLWLSLHHGQRGWKRAIDRRRARVRLPGTAEEDSDLPQLRGDEEVRARPHIPRDSPEHPQMSYELLCHMPCHMRIMTGAARLQAASYLPSRGDMRTVSCPAGAKAKAKR